MSSQPNDAPTTFPVLIDTSIAIDHPSEPMLVVFADGGWEIAYDGDTDFIRDHAPDAATVVNCIPVKAILTDFQTFMQRAASEAAS